MTAAKQRTSAARQHMADAVSERALMGASIPFFFENPTKKNRGDGGGGVVESYFPVQQNPWLVSW